MTSNVVWRKKWYTWCSWVCHWCSHLILTSSTWNLFVLYHIKAKNAKVLQQIICKNKLKYKHDSAYYVNIYIYIYCARDKGVFSPARPITHTGRLLHRPKKKSTDYLHWWITRTLCYSTFWWRKRDIKVIHFSLLKVVWSNFWKRECLFVECKGQRNSDACTILCQ